MKKFKVMEESRFLHKEEMGRIAGGGPIKPCEIMADPATYNTPPSPGGGNAPSELCPESFLPSEYGICREQHIIDFCRITMQVSIYNEIAPK